MANGIWIGKDYKARKGKAIWVGVNGVARRVQNMWVGVNGVAQLCYTRGTRTTVTIHGGKGDVIGFTYNGTSYSVQFGANNTSETVYIYIPESTATITFISALSGYQETRTITAGVSTSVYVRPSVCVFWYGYKDSGFTINTYTASGASGEYARVASNQIELGSNGIESSWAEISVNKQNYDSRWYAHIHYDGGYSGSSGAGSIDILNARVINPNPHNYNDYVDGETYVIQQAQVSNDVRFQFASSSYLAIAVLGRSSQNYGQVTATIKEIYFSTS